MAKIQAVLLDLDGTLLNTFELMYQAFQHAFSSLNLPCPPRPEIQIRMAGGGTLEEMYKSLNPSADFTRLTALHHDFESTHLHLSQPFDDTIATLQRLQQAGYALAIVSNRSRPTLDKLVATTNLSRYFPIIVSGDQLLKPKPDPEPLQRALNYLKISPSASVMIGDTGADIEAGKNAGAFTIGLTCGFAAESIANYHPNLVAAHLFEIIPFILGN